MERFRLCFRNHSVSDHIKCSPNCCLRLTIAFVTVVPVAIVLALLNISPSVNDVLAVIIIVDSILMIISAICWVILLSRKKKLRNLVARTQQEEFGTKLEHGGTLRNPESDMDIQHTTVRNELLQSTSIQLTNRNNLAPLQSPLNNGSCRENDLQGPSPAVPTSDSAPSTPNEAAKAFTFYFDENDCTWKFKNVSSSTGPSRTESVRNESLPSTSASLANSCDLAQRQLPVFDGLLKESDYEEIPDMKASDPVQSTPNEEKLYTLYYDEDLKIFTFKNSTQNIDVPESNCCATNCWARSMKPVNVNRPLSEKNASFELATRSPNDYQQHSKELDKGYLASVEDNYSSLEHFNLNLFETNPKQVHFAAEAERLTSSEDNTSNRGRNQTNPKQVHFAAEAEPMTSSDDNISNRGRNQTNPKQVYFAAEHLTSSEDNTSNPDRNQYNPSSFPTNQSRGLPIAEGRHVTLQEYSGQDFSGNKKGHLSTSDTSSSCDFGLYYRWSSPTNQGPGLPISEGRRVTFRESSEQCYPGNKREQFPSSDTTSSSLDVCPNRGLQRQRSHSSPSQKKINDINARPSILPHGTMHRRSFASNVDQIQSSSTSKNAGIFPPHVDTRRSRILHQLLSAVLRNREEVSPEVNSPHNHSEQLMPSPTRFDKPNVKYKRSPSNNYLVKITMSLTPSEFQYFMEKRKNPGANVFHV